MRVIAVFFGPCAPAVLISACASFLPRLPQVRSIDKTRNQFIYKNCPLPTPEDRLLFLLTYLKTYALQVMHGRLFGMGQSNANPWIHVLLFLSDTHGGRAHDLRIAENHPLPFSRLGVELL